MRWDQSVEQAWLSLFRFIEFWMGLSYMEPSQIETTLKAIEGDPRLPGGSIDTEYVGASSAGGVDEIPPSSINTLAEGEENSQPETKSDAKAVTIEGELHWIQDFHQAPKRAKQE